MMTWRVGRERERTETKVVSRHRRSINKAELCIGLNIYTLKQITFIHHRAHRVLRCC